ncbi:hypothetical protein [Streptomyces pinistramenti]|uniref:hypothetical protein n=1 Tax=Streptomyces pinistramenti TaxID=2884812 RepID=UPI001D06BD06|nr:hypothetical protein [Streptomyces pinistramenti]MCB5910365.1 hypothetical protein [Streptomyces pinistramenti]
MFQHPQRPPATPPAGDAESHVAALIGAVEDAYRPAPAMPTVYRDTSPLPLTGTAPPVAQPGQPPMSQRATDASGLMLAAGVASVPVGGSTALVLWALGQVDPVVLALAGAAPVALLIALARVIKHTKAASQDTPAAHHHYAGPVHQEHRQVTTTTRGVIARTTNGG